MNLGDFRYLTRELPDTFELSTTDGLAVTAVFVDDGNNCLYMSDAMDDCKPFMQPDGSVYGGNIDA